MTACGATCGITRARERDREAARDLARRVWPAGRDGAPAWAPDDPPFPPEELARIAAQVEAILPARCVVVTPPRDDAATFVYVVATTADATWLALRESARDDLPDAPEERGLRVGLSPFGRLATLQEFSIRGEAEGSGIYIEERRVAGVEDRRLQTFVKALQGALRAAKVTTLDAAFLAEPFGATTLWSALFDPDPAVAAIGVYLPAPQGVVTTR